MSLLRHAASFAQAAGDGGFLDSAIDEVTSRDVAGTIAILVITAVLWVLISSVGHRVAERVADRRVDKLDEVEAAETRQRMMTLWIVLRRVLVIVLLVLAVLLLLAWWDVPLAPFLAVGSVVGVAIGFGAQNLIKDIIAGFFIVSENQYSIGDVVQISDVTGSVEDIRLRVTVLRDLEGNVYYVPNGSIVVTRNATQEFSAVVVDVGVAYHEDVDRVIEVLGDLLAAFHDDPDWADVFLDAPEILGVNRLADSAVEVRVVFKVLADMRWVAKREFLRRVKNRLDAEGIEIPFPHRTLVPGEPAAWREALGTGSSGS